MVHRIDAGANGRLLDVRPGDELQIELGENPTTGYRWRVADVGDGLVATGSSYAPEGSGVGAGGRRTLVFRALRPGLATLRLERSRAPDQHASDPADRFELTVRVGDEG
ncbi:MAG TPA: protease inhibitor I42 family protein [Longimicrobiales bacterium]